MYLVTTLVKNLSLKSSAGRRQTVKATWFVGQSGVCPVFFNINAAQAYAAEVSAPVYEVDFKTGSIKPVPAIKENSK